MKEKYRKNIIGKKILSVCIVSLCVVILLSFCGCGAKMSSKSEYSNEMSESFAADADIQKNASREGSAPDANDNKKPIYEGNRKIIRNASLELSTEKYADTIKGIEKATADLGGYIQDSRETKYDDFAWTTITARIPTDKLDAFLSQMDGIATVDSKSVSSDDITSSYVDTESKIKALQTEQETLLSLLSGAQNLSEILEIQDRLTDVRSELEYYQNLMDTFENELSYSTVSIEITEVKHETPTGSGYWSNMFTGLKESFYNIGTGIANFISDVIIALPYLLIAALLVFVVYKIIKRIIKKEEEHIKRTKEGKHSGENNEN